MRVRKNVLTTGEVAKLCNVAPRTVSKWFDAGQLRGYRIPGSKDRRIPVDQLMRFMRAHGLPLNGLDRETTQWGLTPEEKSRQKLINEKYQMDSPVAMFFAEHYTIDPNSDKYETVADIMDVLFVAGLKGNQRANMHELSRLMKRMGAETYRPKINGKRPRAYKGVISLKDED